MNNDFSKEIFQDDNVLMERMSWSVIHDKMEQGFRTVVFAVGATEQHGPHMPIATDTLLGTATSHGVAVELGNALVAPTIRPGFSPHHMDFPGTITLRQDTLIALIVDYCTSLSSHGFGVIVVISSHGGNTSIVKMASQEAQNMVKERSLVIPITNVVSYWHSNYDRHVEGYHATQLETSRILALTPNLVTMNRAQDWSNPINPKITDVGALLGLRPVKFFAIDGTMGKPSGASAELGRESIQYICRNIANQVRAILNLINYK